MQAFEPPFDMSQYVDADVHAHAHSSNLHDHSHVDCTHSSERDDCSIISISRSNLSLDEQHDNPKEDTKTHGSSMEIDNKV